MPGWLLAGEEGLVAVAQALIGHKSLVASEKLSIDTQFIGLRKKSFSINGKNQPGT